MVQQVEAYEASDGSLHRSQLAAAEHEARQQLSKCLRNSGLVNEILQNLRCVFDAAQMILLANGTLVEAAKLAPASKPERPEK